MLAAYDILSGDYQGEAQNTACLSSFARPGSADVIASGIIRARSRPENIIFALK